MIEEGVLDVLATTVNTALEDSRNHVDRRVGVHTNQEYEEAPPVHQDAYPVDDDSLSSNVESEEEKPSRSSSRHGCFRGSHDNDIDLKESDEGRDVEYGFIV